MNSTLLLTSAKSIRVDQVRGNVHLKPSPQMALGVHWPIDIIAGYGGWFPLANDVHYNAQAAKAKSKLKLS